MRNLLYKLSLNIARIFRGSNLMRHFAAILLTYILVVSGFDWLYFSSTRNVTLQLFFFPAVIGGGLLPILAPLALLLAGQIKKNYKILNTAFALGQAALLGLLISDFYKSFTGRPGPPEIFGNGSIVDISRVFHFGFLRGGVFWGWPSTHTTIAFAMAMALVKLYPKNKLAQFLAIIYAFYIGIGVSMTIHWFSDFVAGAIIGSVIGIVVGKSFWERYSFLKSKI